MTAVFTMLASYRIARYPAAFPGIATTPWGGMTFEELEQIAASRLFITLPLAIILAIPIYYLNMALMEGLSSEDSNVAQERCAQRNTSLILGGYLIGTLWAIITLINLPLPRGIHDPNWDAFTGRTGDEVMRN